MGFTRIYASFKKQLERLSIPVISAFINVIKTECTVIDSWLKPLKTKL